MMGDPRALRERAGGRLRLPLPWPVLVTVVLKLFKGDKVDRVAAECALIQFDGFMRPSEAVTLAVTSVLVPVQLPLYRCRPAPTIYTGTCGIGETANVLRNRV